MDYKLLKTLNSSDKFVQGNLHNHIFHNRFHNRGNRVEIVKSYYSIMYVYTYKYRMRFFKTEKY